MHFGMAHAETDEEHIVAVAARHFESNAMECTCFADGTPLHHTSPLACARHRAELEKEQLDLLREAMMLHRGVDSRLMVPEAPPSRNHGCPGPVLLHCRIDEPQFGNDAYDGGGGGEVGDGEHRDEEDGRGGHAQRVEDDRVDVGGHPPAPPRAVTGRKYRGIASIPWSESAAAQTMRGAQWQSVSKNSLPKPPCSKKRKRPVESSQPRVLDPPGTMFKGRRV